MKTAARFLLLAAAIGVIAHVAALWALPRVVMDRTMTTLQDLAGGKANVALRPNPPDHTARTVVMPSPDLLYTICVYDLARGPVELSTERYPPGYWSLALYDASTDNFLTINDNQQVGRPLRLVLTDGPQAADTVRSIVSPSRRGIVLFRSLLLDPADRAAIDTARATMECRELR